MTVVEYALLLRILTLSFSSVDGGVPHDLLAFVVHHEHQREEDPAAQQQRHLHAMPGQRQLDETNTKYIENEQS